MCSDGCESWVTDGSMVLVHGIGDLEMSEIIRLWDYDKSMTASDGREVLPLITY